MPSSSSSSRSSSPLTLLAPSIMTNRWLLVISLVLNTVMFSHFMFQDLVETTTKTATALSSCKTSHSHDSSSYQQTFEAPKDLNDNNNNNAASASSSSCSMYTNHPHLLEQLSYKYGSDKSHDDHGYTDLYQMLFDSIRFQVQNITEIGVSAGQSLQAWYHYFPNAHVHAFDVETRPSAAAIVQQLRDRVHFQQVDLLLSSDKSLQELAGLHDETMDVIWEDATHLFQQQQDFLVKLFRLVKPGGYYIIEDIYYARRDSRAWRDDITQLRPAVQEILYNNDVIFVDTHVGHRNWKLWLSRTKNAKNHVYHNSYLIVIRKRRTPVPEFSMNLGRVAMKSDQVLLEDGED